MEDEYTKQAEAFLKETNTEFKVAFLKMGKYFDDDKEERDIYEITLKRGDREFKFTFGQSTNASGDGTFIDSDGKREKIHVKKDSVGKVCIQMYKGQGLNNGNFIKNKDFAEPTAYDVLAGMQKYEVGSFEDFCGDFGYDTDSRKAEKTYLAVKNEFDNLKMLYSDAELEKMQEIQ